MRVALVFITLAVMLLSACHNSGSEYLGSWKAKTKKDVLDVAKNGDSFIVTLHDINSWDGSPRERKMPASLDNGMLRVETGIIPVKFSYVTATDTLTGDNTEYTRVK